MQSSEKEYNFYLEAKPVIPDIVIYPMDHPKFFLSNQKEEFISV